MGALAVLSMFGLNDALAGAWTNTLGSDTEWIVVWGVRQRIVERKLGVDDALVGCR